MSKGDENNMIEAINTLYDFNRKATEQVLATAEKLTKEQWLADQTAGRGSIRDTLVHLASGMRSWLTVWGGTLPPEEAARKNVDPDQFATVSDVRAFFRTVDAAVQGFIDKLTPAQLDEVRTRTTSAGVTSHLPLWQMMLAVNFHSMQHRSEVAAMLTAFGHSPGELGLTTFLPSRQP